MGREYDVQRSVVKEEIKVDTKPFAKNTNVNAGTLAAMTKDTSELELELRELSVCAAFQASERFRLVRL